MSLRGFLVVGVVVVKESVQVIQVFIFEFGRVARSHCLGYPFINTRSVFAPGYRWETTACSNSVPVEKKAGDLDHADQAVVEGRTRTYESKI